MTLPEEVNEYLKHIVKCIKETMPVSAIYLFGSYATGQQHQDSDLDIYIVTPDKSKRKVDRVIETRKAIGYPKKYAMDILVGYEDDFHRRSKMLNTVENEVIENGVSLYAST